MIKILSHLDLLAKHILGAPIESINVINAIEAKPCENAAKEIVD